MWTGQMGVTHHGARWRVLEKSWSPSRIRIVIEGMQSDWINEAEAEAQLVCSCEACKKRDSK